MSLILQSHQDSQRIMDISRAKEWINYNPETSLEEGLTETWNWFKQNQSEYLSSTTISQSHDKSTNYRNNRNGWVTSTRLPD